MASHSDYVEYVVEQLRGAGSIRARKMFGEYGLYCDGTFFAVISMTSCLSKLHHKDKWPFQTCRKPRLMKEQRTLL